MLKNPRKTLALVCITLIVVIAVFSWAILRSNRLGDSAQEMALQIVEDAFSGEYPTLLIENSHRDFQADVPVELLVRYVEGITRQTGPLESLESIRGDADIPLLSLDQSVVFASYEIRLNFRDTPADLEIDMQLTEDRWLVTRFEVFADLLAN